MIIINPNALADPRRFWKLYVPGLVCMGLGILILLAPHVLAVLAATLFLFTGVLLSYLTLKFHELLKSTKGKEASAEVDPLDEMHRVLKREAERLHFVN